MLKMKELESYKCSIKIKKAGKVEDKIRKVFMKVLVLNSMSKRWWGWFFNLNIKECILLNYKIKIFEAEN